MIKVYNLKTGEEQHYMDSVGVEKAVKTSYALEQGLLTGVISVDDLKENVFPLLKGKRTLSCGDWCVKLQTTLSDFARNGSELEYKE